MRLDLREVMHTPGAHKDFRETLELRDVELFGERPFAEGVEISGTVRNMAGALTLTGRARGALHTRCDRCLKPLRIPFEAPVDILLAEELANDAPDAEGGEIVLLTDAGVELDEIFTQECILSVDRKHLCSPECKGLCPRCGKDLNEGPCGCRKELDPRFAALAKLLDTGFAEPDGK